MDKTIHFMNSERGALVRGSNPPWGHRVHTMAGDMYVAGAGQACDKKNNWPLVCTKQIHIYEYIWNRRERLSYNLKKSVKNGVYIDGTYFAACKAEY